MNGIDGIIENLITNAIRYTDREIEIFLDKSDVFTIKNISSMLRQEDISGKEIKDDLDEILEKEAEGKERKNSKR